MNAGQLYTDEYYAWSPYPLKGKFTPNAQKVRLTSVETRKQRGDANARTYAIVTVVETGEKKTVRAREIVGFWDDYHNEAEFLRKERLDREREVQRQQTREMVMSALIATKLQEKTDMQIHSVIQYRPYSETIVLSLNEVVQWLGITDQDVEAKVNLVMEEDAEVQDI